MGHYAHNNGGDFKESCESCQTERERDQLKAELAGIDAALNRVTMVVSPSRAERITDAFEHNELVTDAVVFDHQKAEQSSRAQCILWMSTARQLAIDKESLRELLGRARGLVEIVESGWSGSLAPQWLADYEALRPEASVFKGSKDG